MSVQLQSLSSKSQIENGTGADLALQNNKLLPVFRLCLDLLQFIFLLCANNDTDHHLRRRRVLSYAQTCHDWRIAALGVKHLWRQLAEFDIMSWAWNQEMLRRSHPLTVAVGSRTWPPRDAAVVVKELTYMERIHTYRLGFTTETWEDVVQGLQSPSDTLEYLSLAHIPSKSHWDHRRLILPSTIFSSSAPCLRQLKLEGCFVDARTPALRHLTSLTIIDIDKCYNTAPTIQEWTKLLGTMPLLVELSLKNAISSSTSSLRPRRKTRISDPLASPGMVSIAYQCSTTRLERPVLRKLEKLYLEGSLPEVAALLAATDLPGALEVSLVCTECYVGEELESIERFWALNPRQSFERRRTAPAQRPALPLLLSASNSRVCLRSDEQVLISAAALISATAEPQPAPFASVPRFYLDIRGTQDSNWEVLLPSILSELSDPLNESTDDPSTLASLFSSLEIALPSPHLDLLPFLAKCVNAEILVNIPGGIGGWLFQELQTSTRINVSQTHSQHQPLASSDHPHSQLLPQLRMVSLSDDRCMYGSAWKSLVGCLQSRCTNHSQVLPSPTTSEDGGKDNGFEEVQLSHSNTVPIEVMAYKNFRLAKDKLAALNDLGVRVVEAEGPKAL